MPGVMSVTRRVQEQRRVTTQLGGANSGTGRTFTNDYNARYLYALPVTPLRWRLRIRNYSPLNATSGTGTATVTAYIGTPAVPTSGLYRWTGTMASVAATAVQWGGSGSTTISGATEITSDWTTGNITQGIPFVLSVGYGSMSSLVAAGGDSTGGLSREASGAAAAANSTSSFTATTSTMYMDVRIEYEYVTDLRPDGRPYIPTVLVVGDSIAAGHVQTQFASAGPWNYGTDKWPEQAALRNGFAVANIAIGQSRVRDAGTGAGWDAATSTAHAFVARADLATTVPDACIIALGINDVNNSTYAQIQAAYKTLVDNVRAWGISRIHVCTVTPGNAPLDKMQAIADTQSSTTLKNLGVIQFDYGSGMVNTAVPAAALLREGMPISGARIAANTVIEALTSPGLAEITNAATGSQAGDAITFAGAQHYTGTTAEIRRQQLNDWLRQCPYNVNGYFDMAQAIELSTFPAVADPRYVPHAPHPINRGLHRMAAVVQY